MSVQFRSSRFIAACGAALMIAASAPADVVIRSHDGRWGATIIDSGGGAGQCNGVWEFIPFVGSTHFLANARHYVRMGSSISYPSATSVRMENHFHLLSFANSDDAYTAVLAHNTLPGVIAIVHGEMIAGNAGGLRVSLTFADMDPPELVLARQTVKPFVYANLNVDEEMLNNTGGWSTDHFHQTVPGSSNVRWFRGRDPLHRSSRFNSTVQQLLDNGVQELDDLTVTGPGDINTAISFAAGGLGPAQSHTVAYAIGNQYIAIPAGFGLDPTSGAVGVSSPDHRWSANVRTGLGYVDGGSAGEINAVYDFAQPLAQAQFTTLATYYLGVSTGTVFSGEPFKDAFRRVAFYYPTDSASMFSAVLNHKDYPGLIMILDGKGINGTEGGVVVCMKFADTLGRGYNIASAAYADMDVNGQTANVGGMDGDRFWQSPSGAPSIKWFRAASFGSYFSNPNTNVQSLMNLGLVVLPNTLYGGTGNIGTAFGFEPWPLENDQPYVTGFALGNPQIEIPGNFVTPSVWFACPGDVAPAGGNGAVDIDDLLTVISSWGICPKGGCAGDIVPPHVGDGAVDIDDLLAVISAWGDCFPE